MNTRYTLSLLLALFLISCHKDSGVVPSYIYIKDIQVQTTSGQGTNSDDIVDAWVYVDDNAVGCFSLPARIPIIGDGPHKITIYGGIKADGISSHRRRYPFYQPYILNSYTLHSGMVDTLQGAYQPIVTYYPNTEMNFWIEDFTDPFIPFLQDPLSDTSMARTTTPGEYFEGGASGVMTLSANQIYFKAATSENFDLPIGGVPVYLELNYKANNTFSVGLTSVMSGNVVNQDNTIIRPSYDDNGNLVWKKMYCEMTELVSSNLNALYYEIYFKMTKDEGVTEPLVLIDNVKLVYGNN